MKKKYLFISIFVFIIIGTIVVFTLNKTLDKKQARLDEVKLKEIVKQKNTMFAIMLEQSNGTYTESQSNSWPASGYTFNSTKSGCVDKEGNRIEGALSYDSSNYIANVTAGKTVQCYLYFDILTIALTTDQGTSGLSVGDVVTISKSSIPDQEFYVISTDASETTLFAKYNLYVGNVYSDQGNTLVKKLTSADEGYGLQNSTAKGACTGVATIGTVPFSKTNYWPNSGTITANIYDSTLSETEDWTDTNYSVAYYVEQYVRLLNIPATGRLLIDSERRSLETSSDYSSILFNQSSYYIGTSACRYGSCPYVVTIGNNSYSPYVTYNSVYVYGVRPVLVISTSDIDVS